MKKIYIFAIIAAISLFVDINVYFDDLIFYPHEECNALTYWGELYDWIYQIYVVLFIPLGLYNFYNIIIKDSDEYRIKQNRFFWSIIGTTIIGLTILSAPLIKNFLLYDTCPSPEVTPFGIFFLILFFVLYNFACIFGTFEFVFRCFQFIEYVGKRIN